jgi:Na+-driven multidrug efflux pump
MVLARGLPNVIWIGFVTYNSLITVRLMDGTPAQAGLLVAVGSLVFAVAGSQAGRITDLLDSRVYPLLGANVLLGIGLATLAHRVVPIYYGPAFEAAVAPLLVLIPGALGFAAARPILAISQASGRIRILVGAVAGSASVNVVLNAVLIPVYGMTGAAAATSIGYGSMVAMLVWTAWRIGFDPLGDLRPVRVALTALVAAPVIVAVDDLLRSDVTALIVVPLLGLGVYSAAALLTGAVDRDEVLEILGRVPGPIGRIAESHAP